MNIDQAISTLKSGGVIAFPTETVFGIGACIDQPAAIARIYELKKRPKDKPLQILVASLEQAKTLGEFSLEAEEFARKNWPGPYTLVVKKKNGAGTIGLRVPDHEVPLALIKECGPLAATSANQSGEKPATDMAEIKSLVFGVDYVVPGKVVTGKASKVIDFSAGGRILRG
ncbi:MAG: L-threonylcarbamoyladenylate synthase [bacterium]